MIRVDDHGIARERLRGVVHDDEGRSRSYAEAALPPYLDVSGRAHPQREQRGSRGERLVTSGEIAACRAIRRLSSNHRKEHPAERQARGKIDRGAALDGRDNERILVAQSVSSEWATPLPTSSSDAG